MNADSRVAVNNGRRWLALARRDDGTFEMKVMLGDEKKPLATLPFDRDQWERLVSEAGELLRR
jgi:hypothetical protein